MNCDCTNRQRVKRGEALPWSKLTEEDVMMIRELYEWKQAEIKRLNSIASAKALAEKFGVSTQTIEKVIARETWGHV